MCVISTRICTNKGSEKINLALQTKFRASRSPNWPRAVYCEVHSSSALVRNPRTTHACVSSWILLPSLLRFQNHSQVCPVKDQKILLRTLATSLQVFWWTKVQSHRFGGSSRNENQSAVRRKREGLAETVLTLSYPKAEGNWHWKPLKPPPRWRRRGQRKLILIGISSSWPAMKLGGTVGLWKPPWCFAPRQPLPFAHSPELSHPPEDVKAEAQSKRWTENVNLFTKLSAQSRRSCLNHYGNKLWLFEQILSTGNCRDCIQNHEYG